MPAELFIKCIVKISKDINDGKIYENKALSDAMDAAKANASHFTLWDFFQTAVYTATTNTFTVC